VASYAIDGSDQRWLSRSGHVSALQYSFTLPGGASTMSCTLQVPPDSPRKALEAGRIVRIFRGGLTAWEGKMDMPAPSEQEGWAVAAHGAGTYGADFMASYSGTWTAAGPITDAITRGLRWTNPGLPGGVYVGQVADPASISLADHLDAITNPVGMAWYVGRWNVLAVAAPATIPTRILWATSPILRTLHGYYTRIWAKYQVSADTTSGGAAVNGLTFVENAANVARHGRIEKWIDLSPAGNKTSAQAQAVISSILAKYQDAGYGEAITIQPGQLTNMGGAPVDLASEQPGAVCQVMLATASAGGDISPVIPGQFLIGATTYDDEAQTLAITPYGAVEGDLDAMLNNWVTLHPAPSSPATA
jgi:hypothetical protein